MPFTFAHPAAVLPLNYLKKHRLSLTGLVIGSMVPDFEYFIRMKDVSFFSHTIPGVFYFDLPLALLLTFAFHNWVRNPLILHCPVWLQRRLFPYIFYQWNKWFRRHWKIIILSILIGVATHLLWDRFTHKTVALVEQIPEVKNHLHTHREKMVNYYLFWNLSTGIGMLAIFYALWQLPVSRKAKINHNITTYWLTVVLITAGVFWLKFYVDILIHIKHDLVTIISGFLIALFVSGGLFRRQENLKL